MTIKKALQLLSMPDRYLRIQYYYYYYTQFESIYRCSICPLGDWPPHLAIEIPEYITTMLIQKNLVTIAFQGKDGITSNNEFRARWALKALVPQNSHYCIFYFKLNRIKQDKHAKI